jgi:tRNA (guanine-N7-)-methyltransferase
MPRVRVHQHVNPLAPFFRFIPEPVELDKVFADPTLPLFLDIGSARGRFILRMAEGDASMNYLGIEIREPLVHEANRLAKEAGLTNLHYEFTNALLSLDKSLANLPEGILKTVTIQFPDPWFKKKHAKRRMVTPALALTVISHLAPGGTVFIQTDIEFLADEMFEVFRQSDDVKEEPTDVNPFPFKTERETAVEEKGLPVYRRVFLRKR